MSSSSALCPSLSVSHHHALAVNRLETPPWMFSVGKRDSLCMTAWSLGGGDMDPCCRVEFRQVSAGVFPPLFEPFFFFFSLFPPGTTTWMYSAQQHVLSNRKLCCIPVTAPTRINCPWYDLMTVIQTKHRELGPNARISQYPMVPGQGHSYLISFHVSAQRWTLSSDGIREPSSAHLLVISAPFTLELAGSRRSAVTPVL